MTKLRKYSLDKKKKKAFHPVNSDLGLWFLWLQQYYDLFSLEHSTISENDTVFLKRGLCFLQVSNCRVGKKGGFTFQVFTN